MGQKTGHLYKFGPFLLDTAQHVLSRRGEPVPLTPKTYDMLLVLVESHGRLLPKEELMKALWPSSFVEESNLTQQISMLRKVLGESAGEDRYIVTISGRGYRFAAAVEDCSAQADNVSAGTVRDQSVVAGELSEPNLPSGIETRAPGVHWRRILFTAVVLTLAIAVLGYSIYRKQSIKGRHTGGPRTLAVLPFQSLRRDPVNDFLGFSLADTVITKLGYVKSLTVRPSSAVERYRRQAIDISRIAADLRVDTILTGNFIRDGDDLRITSQLIDVRTQTILWKGAFDSKYVRLLTVQDRVAHEIISGLALSLSAPELERLKPDKPIDPAAYEYYLRGVDLYWRNDFPMAIKMLQRSAEIDPSYALTWAHLGRAHTANASFELGGRDEYLSAQKAYEKALAIQPALAEAQIFMANRFTDTGRVESAVPLLREALRVSPNHAEAHWELGYAYRFGGMLNESVAECERVRQLDAGVKLSTSTRYLYLG
jgi:DNA-binding winged helix-turn-helix (wHTH) protein/TolB-like protein